MNTPLISIVIPLFNSELYFEETLQSLLAQSYTNWESIIVDDGSTDSSICIAEKVQKYDNRIFIYRREDLPKGGSVCRNIGIKKSRGEYIIFLDSDDLLSPTCLENRVKLIEQNSDTDFAIFPVQEFSVSPTDGRITSRLAAKNHLAHFIATDCIWHTTSPIWRKQTLLSLNGFDESLPRLQDPNLHMRALLFEGIKYSVYSLENADCFYRVLPKTDSARFSEMVFSAYRMHLNEIISRLDYFKSRPDYDTSIVPAFEWALLASFLYFWSSPNHINDEGKIILSDYSSAMPLKPWVNLYLKLMILMHKISLNRFYIAKKTVVKIHTSLLVSKQLSLG